MKPDTLEVLIGSGKQKSTAEKYYADLKMIEKLTGTNIDKFKKSDYNKLITLLGRRTVAQRFRISENQIHSSSSVRGFIFALKRYWRSTGQRDKLHIFDDVDLPRQKPVRPKPILSGSVLKDFFADVWSMPLNKYERRRYHVKGEFLEFRNKFIVIFSYFFACRRSEVPLIKLSGVNRDEKTIIVTESKITGQQFVEPATSDIFWGYFDSYMSLRRQIPGDFLFCSKGGRQLDSNTVYLSARMCDKLLGRYKVRGVNLTPHLMRRSMATKAAGELSLKDGMRVTRHGSVQAFQKYIDLSDDKGAIERIRSTEALNI
jgi:integrase